MPATAQKDLPTIPNSTLAPKAPAAKPPPLPKPPLPTARPLSEPPPLERPVSGEFVRLPLQSVEAEAKADDAPPSAEVDTSDADATVEIAPMRTRLPPALAKATLVIELPLAALDDEELTQIHTWMRGRATGIILRKPSVVRATLHSVAHVPLRAGSAFRAWLRRALRWALARLGD